MTSVSRFPFKTIQKRNRVHTLIFSHEFLHKLIALDVVAGTPLPCSKWFAVFAHPDAFLGTVRVFVDGLAGQTPPGLFRHGGIAHAYFFAEVDLLQSPLQRRAIANLFGRVRMDRRGHRR